MFLFGARRASSAPGDSLVSIQEDEIESACTTSGGGRGDVESATDAPSPVITRQPNMYQRPAAIPQHRFINPQPVNPWQNQGFQPQTTSPAPPPKKIEVVQPIEIPYSEISFVSLIGEGGFGKVWLADYQGSKVAVKVATPKPGTESTMLKEFQREVATMSSVPPHENIIRLRGVCTQPPNLALVSDYCPKGSLYQALHTPGDYRLDDSLLKHTCISSFAL
jgi:hypothetical protein